MKHITPSRSATELVRTGDSPFGACTLITAVFVVPDFTHLAIPAGTFGTFTLRAGLAFFQTGACVTTIGRLPTFAEGMGTAMGWSRDATITLVRAAVVSA